MKLPIYMDYHATTPVDPRVVEAMMPYFTEHFGNAASRQHRYGWVAQQAVDRARDAIARALNAEAGDIVFTAGATESNNLAIKGVAEALTSHGNHIITCGTEHKSVLDVCRRLAKRGFDVTVLPVDEEGMIDLDTFARSIKETTILVTLMIANNEIGTIHPVAEIGRVCRSRNVYFHADGTQAVGKIPVDVQEMNIDLLSFSAHKMYGPKGVGGLYVRGRNPRVTLVPQMDGGGHERGRRSGTLNVPGIVGLGRAVELCVESMAEESKRLAVLRDRLQTLLIEGLEDVYVNGHPSHRLPNNLNMSFLGVEDNALMMSMKDVAVASGSACSSAEPMPSHVLKALGIGPERQNSALRFGLGRWTTEEEVEYVAGRVIEETKKLRAFSARYRSAKFDA